VKLLPRRMPYWATGISRGNPVFDLYWLGFWCVVFDHTKSFYPRGWIVTWNDDE
jgi:hypothetical protein